VAGGASVLAPAAGSQDGDVEKLLREVDAQIQRLEREIARLRARAGQLETRPERPARPARPAPPARREYTRSTVAPRPAAPRPPVRYRRAEPPAPAPRPAPPRASPRESYCRIPRNARGSHPAACLIGRV